MKHKANFKKVKLWTSHSMIDDSLNEKNKIFEPSERRTKRFQVGCMAKLDKSLKRMDRQKLILNEGLSLS